MGDLKQVEDQRDELARSNDAEEERAAAHARALRAEMTAPGLRPCDPPLPDRNDPEFQAQIRRECEIINNSPEEQQILAELEQWFDDSDWVYDWE